MKIQSVVEERRTLIKKQQETLIKAYGDAEDMQGRAAFLQSLATERARLQAELSAILWVLGEDA